MSYLDYAICPKCKERFWLSAETSQVVVHLSTPFLNHVVTVCNCGETLRFFIKALVHKFLDFGVPIVGKEYADPETVKAYIPHKELAPHQEHEIEFLGWELEHDISELLEGD